jgi:thioredoxin 1
VNVSDINSILKEKQAVLLYFSGENCSVCKVLQPKIKEALSEYFKKIDFIEIKSENYPETCATYSVFSIPTIILFLDAKEFARYGRNISIAQFIDNTTRPYNLYFKGETE